MTESILEIRDVFKTYGTGNSSTPVLKGVKLEVQEGECVFLAGPSGSGKSTLLSIVGGILTPDEGQVLLDGRDLYGINQRKRASLRRHDIGFVFQRFQLVRGLSAADNIAVPLILQGYSQRQANKHAKEMLAAVGMPEKAKSLPQQLSGGQCQRVALARALVTEPQLILADEPTAALDSENGRQMMELLRRLINEHGKTAVVVTHDHRIFRFADRICHMENGIVSRQETITEHDHELATA